MTSATITSRTSPSSPNESSRGLSACQILGDGKLGSSQRCHDAPTHAGLHHATIGNPGRIDALCKLEVAAITHHVTPCEISCRGRGYLAPAKYAWAEMFSYLHWILEGRDVRYEGRYINRYDVAIRSRWPFSGERPRARHSSMIFRNKHPLEGRLLVCSWELYAACKVRAV